jgi:hypothetical protein
MGREIRKVPPNWQHPKVETLRFTVGRELRYIDAPQPMYDRDYEDAAREWIDAFVKWHVAKEYDSCADDDDKQKPYWEWEGNPPNRQYYRPWKSEDATWFQLWETVTEGTPVSPPFETLEELTSYLAEHGDYWDQKRAAEGKMIEAPGWGIDNARKFIEHSGQCCSMQVINRKVFSGTRDAVKLDAMASALKPI